MSYLIFILKSAIEDFRRNKVRTFLTSLGILIGVASVVLLIAFGLGLKKYIQNQFESLGTNLIIVLPGQILQGGGIRPGGGALGGAEFDDRDMMRLRRAQHAEYVVPSFIKTVSAVSGKKSELGDIFATTDEMFIIRNLTAKYGRLFRKTDAEKNIKIAVIGPKIAEKLFIKSQDAINRIIKLDNQGYKVIGVLESKGGGGLGGPDFDSFIYIPYKSSYSFNPKKIFQTFYIKVDNKDHIDIAKKNITKVLSKRYKKDDFSVIEQTEILNTVTSIFSILNTVLVFIGAISLIVGGIEIMNIMYVTVVERTREIGIRRAIGATKQDILAQFLAESVILSLIGGSAGVLISFIVTIAIQRVFPAYIDTMSVVIAFFVSTIIGVVFGVFPARKAAKLQPVEAIRYE